jgi:hypothetical protein
MCHNLSILFEFYNITPTSGRILTSEIVLDGISKHFSLSLAILLGVLLGTDNDGL